MGGLLREVWCMLLVSHCGCVNSWCWCIMINLVVAQGDTAYNKDLIDALKYMVKQNQTFINACLFKEHIALPDWMNVIHHEGFWLQVANTSGPTSFLQME